LLVVAVALQAGLYTPLAVVAVLAVIWKALSVLHPGLIALLSALVVQEASYLPPVLAAMAQILQR
jgi:hypothetical protein